MRRTRQLFDVHVCVLPTWLTFAGVRIISRTPDQPEITPVGTA